MPQLTDTVLMIRPASFGRNNQTAVNNYFQQNLNLSANEIQRKALAEFDAFVATLRNAGVTVLIAEDTTEPATPDSIFPNNWVSFHEEGRVVLYPMFAPNRRKEREKGVLDKLQTEYNYYIKEVTDYTNFEDDHQFLEGTGSMVLDRENKVAYAAYSVRMHPEPLQKFAQDMGYTGISFTARHTVNKVRLPIYHTNVMMSVGEQFAVVCLSSIDKPQERQAVQAGLLQTGKEIIEITEAQMERFAGNILQLKNTDGEPVIAMSAAAYRAFRPEQLSALSKYGKLVYSDLTVIETLGGGSARCMLAEVFGRKASV
jgi:hypothetical protein